MRERSQMSRPSPQIRNLAQRLISYERGDKFSEAKIRTFPAFEKLRPHLATLMGNAGFRALLSRALALSNEEVPWLRAVHVKADGSLEGLEQSETQVDPDEFMEGRVALLAQLLGLLVAFIGENLTSGLMREAWPDVPFNDLVSGKGDKNEKGK